LPELEDASAVVIVDHRALPKLATCRGCTRNEEREEAEERRRDGVSVLKRERIQSRSRGGGKGCSVSEEE
jgi:hypothetical protein